MDFQSRLRLLLIVPFYVPVTGGDSGGFMSTVAESTATAPWEESVAKSGIIAWQRMMLKVLFKELLYTCGTLSESIFIVMFVFGQPGLVV